MPRVSKPLDRPTRRVIGRGALAFAVLLFANAAAGEEWKFSGFAAAEVRIFPNDPANPEQDPSIVSPSLVLQPELRVHLDETGDRLTAIPFLRFDADDRSRTHADLRELNWYHDGGDWSLLAGLGKVFWGVTESRHLVDIVNQTDLVEFPDEEDKLGQPMVNVNVFSDWGTFGLFVLPGFRDRTFADRRGRLRGLVPVDADDAVFESDAARRHVDYAARWSHAIGEWDIGLSLFHGTGREPRLLPGFREGGEAVLIPHYDIIDQESVDLQLTIDSWLWKLEALSRGGQGQRFAALVAGFEYTFYGVAGTAADLGVLAEYLHDGRGAEAPPTVFDDDLFLGIRLAFNDVGSTEILAGGVVDRKTAATILSIEAKHRLGDRWSAEFEAQMYSHVPRADFLFGVRRDDFIQLRLIRYF